MEEEAMRYRNPQVFGTFGVLNSTPARKVARTPPIAGYFTWNRLFMNNPG